MRKVGIKCPTFSESWWFALTDGGEAWCWAKKENGATSLSYHLSVMLCWLDQIRPRGEDSDWMYMSETLLTLPKSLQNSPKLRCWFWQLLCLQRAHQLGWTLWNYKQRACRVWKKWFGQISSRSLQPTPHLCLSLQAIFVSTTITNLKCPAQCSVVELHDG